MQIQTGTAVNRKAIQKKKKTNNNKGAHPVLAPPPRDRAAVRAARETALLESLVSELTQNNSMGQVRHARGRTGVAIATTGSIGIIPTVIPNHQRATQIHVLALLQVVRDRYDRRRRLRKWRRRHHVAQCHSSPQIRGKMIFRYK